MTNDTTTPGAGEELKLDACPRCHRNDNLAFCQLCSGGGWGVMCRDCHLTLDTRAGTKAYAAIEWNRRVPPPRAAASVTTASGNEEVAAEVRPPIREDLKSLSPTRSVAGEGETKLVVLHPEPERTVAVISEAYAYLSTVRSVDGVMPAPALLVQRLQSRLERISKHLARHAQRPAEAWKPDREAYEACGWEARKIGGVWCVGMAGNLDTIHDATVTICSFLSDEVAERLAHDIAAMNKPISRPDTETIAESGAEMHPSAGSETS